MGAIKHAGDTAVPMILHRKIIRVGGSSSITIPRPWMSFYNLSCGDVVDLLVDSVLIIKPATIDLNTMGIDRTILNMFAKVSDRKRGGNH
jgi:antitoxin component of MazEF toxin-antitoxin module